MATEVLTQAQYTEPVSSARRIAGLCAIGFALTVGGQNVVRTMLASPPNGAPGADVLAFYVANASLITYGVATISIAMVFLFTFLAFSYEIISKGEAQPWARLGMLGGVFLAATFALTAHYELSLVIAAGELSAETAGLLWNLHATGFSFSHGALAITLLGLARAFHMSGLSSGWHHIMGVAAAVVLFVGALFMVPIAAGSSMIYAIYFGFIGWLVWLGVAGARLFKS